MGICFWGGCANNISRVEMDFGTSYRLMKYNQTLNSNAEKNLEPITRIDGQAVLKTMEEYRKGFEKSDKKQGFTFTIN